jgi:hypothetical protein
MVFGIDVSEITTRFKKDIKYRHTRIALFICICLILLYTPGLILLWSLNDSKYDNIEVKNCNWLFSFSTWFVFTGLIFYCFDVTKSNYTFKDLVLPLFYSLIFAVTIWPQNFFVNAPKKIFDSDFDIGPFKFLVSYLFWMVFSFYIFLYCAAPFEETSMGNNMRMFVILSIIGTIYFFTMYLINGSILEQKKFDQDNEGENFASEWTYDIFGTFAVMLWVLLGIVFSLAAIIFYNKYLYKRLGGQN